MRTHHQHAKSHSAANVYLKEPKNKKAGSGRQYGTSHRVDSIQVKWYVTRWYVTLTPLVQVPDLRSGHELLPAS